MKWKCLSLGLEDTLILFDYERCSKTYGNCSVCDDPKQEFYVDLSRLHLKYYSWDDFCYVFDRPSQFPAGTNTYRFTQSYLEFSSNERVQSETSDKNTGNETHTQHANTKSTGGRLALLVVLRTSQAQKIIHICLLVGLFSSLHLAFSSNFSLQSPPFRRSRNENVM